MLNNQELVSNAINATRKDLIALNNSRLDILIDFFTDLSSLYTYTFFSKSAIDKIDEFINKKNPDLIMDYINTFSHNMIMIGGASKVIQLAEDIITIDNLHVESLAIPEEVRKLLKHKLHLNDVHYIYLYLLRHNIVTIITMLNEYREGDTNE